MEGAWGDVLPRGEPRADSAPCVLCGEVRQRLVHRAPAKQRSAERRGYTISEAQLDKPERVVRCTGCGLVFAAGAPLAQLLLDYEQLVDPEFAAEERGRRAQAAAILEFIGRFKSPGRLLDVGCGPGFLLAEAAARGWHTQGVDLSVWARRSARERFGIDVLQGTLHTAQFAAGSFDAVVMNDVLEHLEDPSAALREVHRVLAEGGILYLATPDIESWASRVLGVRWWGINRYHLFYFSRTTLERLLGAAGFQAQRYSPYPRVFSWSYWLKRLSAYPAVVRAGPRLLARAFGLHERLLSLTLHDQLAVLAHKRASRDGSDESAASG